MKKLLSVAAVALLSTAGVAQADDINWSGTTPAGTYGGAVGLGIYAGATGVFGTAGYQQIGSNDVNSDKATPTVTNTWTIKGNVTKDCSYYGGSSSSHTLDFGQIGVDTDASTNLGNAFKMMSAATATVTSTTAGCNFKNSVSLSKANGVDGLKNNAAGGYDTNAFQANIPYSVTAKFNASTNTGAPAAAGSLTQTAGTGEGSKVVSYGAWRSEMSLSIEAPKAAKALVAGDYQDILTVELKAAI